jgi:hypothetical protein
LMSRIGQFFQLWTLRVHDFPAYRCLKALAAIGIKEIDI